VELQKPARGDGVVSNQAQAHIGEQHHKNSVIFEMPYSANECVVQPLARTAACRP